MNTSDSIRDTVKAASLIVEFMEDANWLGGSVYIENLLSTLSLLPETSQPKVELLFLSSPNSPTARRLLSYPIVQNNGDGLDLLNEMVVIMRGFYRRIGMRFPCLRYLSFSARKGVYFPVFDISQPRRRNLYWIPDFQHHYLPELFSASDLERRNHRYERIAQAEGILLLSSQSALKDFRRFYPNVSVEPRVWSFCSSVKVDDSESYHSVLEKYSLPAKFLYVANQFWMHKDHNTLFESLRLLHEKGIDVPVVCTGKEEDPRNPEYFSSLCEKLARHSVKQVFFLGIIPRSEQIQLYRFAAAVVQPSQFEGWSTVIEDAKALGRPIIASSIDVHKEQLQWVENVHLFRASDPVHLSECIEVLWPDLTSGPDMGAEKLAAKRNDIRRIESAKAFMVIVEEAMTYPQCRKT